MREAVLAEYFNGSRSAASLQAELQRCARRISEVETSYKIEDMTEDFLVTREMLVEICEAALRGDLQLEALKTIGFIVIASNHYHWAEVDEQVAETLYDWASPEVNYPLTPENVSMFRDRLLGDPDGRG